MAALLTVLNSIQFGTNIKLFCQGESDIISIRSVDINITGQYFDKSHSYTTVLKRASLSHIILICNNETNPFTVT